MSFKTTTTRSASDAAKTSRNRRSYAPRDSSGDLGAAAIFVSVAAYRDPEAEATLADLFETAARPGRIRACVVQQYDCEAGADDALVGRLKDPDVEKRVERVRVDFRDAAGPCPARAAALARLGDHDDYVLQIDSHARFRRNWDAYLIRTLGECPARTPILTAYPAGYHAGAGSALPKDHRPTLLVPSKFDEHGALRLKGRRLAAIPKTPTPSPLWCAGFSFSRAALWREGAVPYDGSLRHLFFGEELVQAARLFTSGCDFFAPPEQVLFHLWERGGRRTIFQDADAGTRASDAARSRAAIFFALGLGPAPPSSSSAPPPRGLGSKRPLAAFEAAARIDLAARTLLPDAEDGGLAPGAFARGGLEDVLAGLGL